MNLTNKIDHSREDSESCVNINNIPPQESFPNDLIEIMKPLKLVPLSTNLQCKWFRDECDQRISMEIALTGIQTRPVRVYISGVFDLFHFGHAQALRQAKTYFNGGVHLIVGVSDDEDTRKQKGLPIMNMEERVNCIRHCIWADEVLAPTPLKTSKKFIEQNNIDFVCHDSSSNKCTYLEETFAWLKESNMLITTRRTDNISTTDIINRWKNKMIMEKD